MSKMYQIYEEDLETLESECPKLMEFSAFANPGDWNHRKDIQEAWDMIRQIVSRVRWNYGPPTQVEFIGEGNKE